MNEIIPRIGTLPTDFKICRHCGGQIPGDAEVCMFCGCLVSEMPDVEFPEYENMYDEQYDSGFYDSYGGTQNTNFSAFDCSLKYCKFCRNRLPIDAVVCTACGRQIEELKSAEPTHVVINNYNNMPPQPQKLKRRSTALTICLLTGWLGGHALYEGKSWQMPFYLLYFIATIVNLSGTTGIIMAAVMFLLWCANLITILAKPEFYDPKGDDPR